MILKDKIPFSIVVPMEGALNKQLDGSRIGDIELQTAEKVIFDKGITEKAPEFSKVNSADQLEHGDRIDGVWRSYADDGTSRLIAVCGGKIFESSDWTTAIHTGMTAGKRCTFTDYRGKTIISNGYDDPVGYNPKTNVVEGAIGIQGPRQIEKIAYFETDETWTVGVADKDAHVLDEYSGDCLQGLKITAAASATATAVRTGTWDLSTFDDGETIGTWDFVDISIYHRIRANIKAITFRFTTSAGKYFEHSFGRVDLDEDEQRDYQWTTVHIRKNAFLQTSTASWATITEVSIKVEAESTGEAMVTFDNWRFRRTPPVVGEFKKYIATFETTDETWTGGAVDTNRKHVKEGAMGRKLTNALPSSYCDKTLDLSRWISGQDQSLSDEVKIWAFVNDSTKITSVTIKLGNAGLVSYYSKAFTTFDTGTNHWNLLTVKKSDFSETGTPAWASIARIQVEAVLAATGEVTLDKWIIVEKAGETSISTVEKATSGEAWTGGNWSRKYKKAGNWTRERVFDAYNTSGKIQVVFTTAKDLTAWDDASASTTEDFIAFFHKYWMAYAGGWVKTDIRIDCNNGDFATDYYKYTINPKTKDLPGRFKGGYWHIKKREFERIGTTVGKAWNTIKGFRFTIYTGEYFYWVGQVGVVIDDIMLRRKTGLDGRYRWKVCYSALNMKSAPSEATEWLDLTGERAYLHHIPISNDTRVTQREVYRSSYAEEDQPFRYAFTVPDNTTTQYFDDIGDDKLGESMEERGVPSGTIKCPKGLIVDEFKDEIVIFQDPAVLKRMYYADPYYTYSWSELNARDFPTELVGAKVSFDNFYFFLRNGRIYRIDDALSTLPGLIPLGEIFRAVSPWGICKVDADMAIVTDKDINLFSGYEAVSFGEAIEPYLDPDDYKVEESVLFYHQHHLYYSVETRAGGAYKLFDCYVPTKKWEDRGLNVNCFCAYTGKGDKNELVYGGYDGYLYKLATTYNHSMKVRSKDFGDVSTAKGKGFLFHEKELQEVRLIAKGGDATSGALTLKIYKNGADSGEIITIPSSGHLPTVYHTYVITLTGVYNAIVGQLLGYEISHTTATKNAFIKAVMLNGVVIPLEQEFTD